MDDAMDGQCFRHTCARWCALSALAGSALTFVAIRIRLRGRRKNFTRRDCEADDEPNRKKYAEHNGEEAVVTATEAKNGRDRGAFANRRRSLSCTDVACFSGVFDNVDGQKRTHSQRRGSYDFDHSTNGTNVTILSEEQGFLSDDKDVMAAREFDEKVLSKLTSLDESKLLHHRTRAVSALASRLMAAPDEESCYDVVSRLIVPLFRVDRCSYALMKDADHIILKNVTVQQRRHATRLGLESREVVLPLKDTMVGLCAATLRQQYCPRTRESRFETQQTACATIGINTVLATPILVDRGKFAGAIIVSMTEEDAFAFHDRAMIQDIASMLGATIYAKRMRKVAERSNKISREMLYSMIPPQVIEKIEVFWDENSDEYQSRRKPLITPSFATSATRDSDSLDELNTDASIRIPPLNGWVNENQKEGGIHRRNSVSEFINQMNTINSDQNAGIVVDTPRMEIGSVNRALYADNVSDVVIIVTDIVGFSYLATTLDPMEVMSMVQALFSQFDALCDKWGVQKLETVGDAYLVTANLMEEHKSAKDAAVNALNMAKDMILASREVLIPGNRRKSSFETLQIRVGMHVGNVTCGVLGERMPKLSLFGNSMNVACRLEQAGKPNKIRVSEAFHSLIGDVCEYNWDGYEVISMKNMGDIGTYILDPSISTNKE